MKAFKFGALAWLGVLAACATEQEQAREAAEDVRKEAQEARQEVGREVQEGREEVAEARRNLVEELRDQEKSGEPVEFDAVVTGHDADTVMLRLENGETFEVDYNPQSRFMRGESTVVVTELQPGTNVHVTYRIVDGRRIIDEIDVSEAAAPTGTQPADGLTPGAGGGTR